MNENMRLQSEKKHSMKGESGSVKNDFSPSKSDAIAKSGNENPSIERHFILAVPNCSSTTFLRRKQSLAPRRSCFEKACKYGTQSEATSLVGTAGSTALPLSTEAIIWPRNSNASKLTGSSADELTPLAEEQCRSQSFPLPHARLRKKGVSLGKENFTLETDSAVVSLAPHSNVEPLPSRSTSPQSLCGQRQEDAGFAGTIVSHSPLRDSQTSSPEPSLYFTPDDSVSGSNRCQYFGPEPIKTRLSQPSEMMLSRRLIAIGDVFIPSI